VDVLTHPDLEAVVSQTLRDANIRAYSSLPKTPQFPLIVVKRVGGTPPVRQYLDAANIQLDVWGSAPDDPAPVPKSTIQDLAQQARVLILKLEGKMVYGPVQAFITGVDDALGISWLPDPLTGRERYLFGMWVYGRSFILNESSS